MDLNDKTVQSVQKEIENIEKEVQEIQEEGKTEEEIKKLKQDLSKIDNKNNKIEKTRDNLNKINHNLKKYMKLLNDNDIEGEEEIKTVKENITDELHKITDKMIILDLLEEKKEQKLDYLQD